jgi:DNA polymerase III subunit alpha
MAYINLVTHTEYSMLQASNRVKDVIGKVTADGQNALAITDHSGLFGTLEFYFKAKDAGINPIIGCEVWLTENEESMNPRTADRIILLCENQQGYDNLMRLVSDSWIKYNDAGDRPLVPWKNLRQYNEGLIALYGGMRSHLGELLDKPQAFHSRVENFLEIFDKDHFYLMLQNHLRPREDELIQLTKKSALELDLLTVVTNDTHYLNVEDADAHRVLKCIQKGILQKEFNDPDFIASNYHLPTESEIRARFPDESESIDRTSDIANRCHILIETGVGDKYWPKFPIPEQYNDEDELLAGLTWEKAKTRYPNMNEETRERLQYELDMMKSMKVAGYMLIVQDFINWAKDNDIPVGPGRGSAVGSAVSFAIGITNVEPMKYQLLFERFLNPERVSMPDIDIDFSDKDRQTVIDYVIEKYGSECVAQLITYGRLKAKAVLKDVARALGINHNEIDRINKCIPLLGYDLQKSWDGIPEVVDHIEAGGELFAKLWEYSLKLENLIRQTGIHAAAVIIAPQPLVELAPLYVAPGDTSIVIQYDKSYAEDIGMLKMDFLGLRTLSVMKDATTFIKEQHGVIIDTDEIPVDDEATYRLLGAGLTTGVFQFESQGMQQYLRKLKPTVIDDMIAMNALYRPGPIENIPSFIDRKHGNEEIDCFHDDFIPFLGDTYGVIVYQEQVMLLAQQLSSFSLGGADVMRRIMAKKKPAELEKLKPTFFDGATKNGYDERMVERIWETLLPFCNYAFNKSHSVAYGYIGYQTAYLKTHYPPEFMAANMNSEIDTTDRLVILAEECLAIDLTILSPSINRSDSLFSVKEGCVDYALAGTKGVGVSVMQRLVKERNDNGLFPDIFEFTERMAGNQMNKRVLENLIMAGALDCLNVPRHILMASSDLALEHGTNRHREKEMGQVSLFGEMESANALKPDLVRAKEWSNIETLAREKEVLGVSFSGHPLDTYKIELQSFRTCSLSEEDINAQNVPEPKKKKWGEAQEDIECTIVLGGIISTLRTLTSEKTGRDFTFATLTDHKGSIELVFWSDAWEKVADMITLESMIFVLGNLAYKRDSTDRQVIVEDVTLLEDARMEWTQKVTLHLDMRRVDEETLIELEELVDIYQSDKAQLILSLESRDLKNNSETQHQLMVQKNKIQPEAEFIEDVHKLLGPNSISLKGKVL